MTRRDRVALAVLAGCLLAAMALDEPPTAHGTPPAPIAHEETR